MSRPTEDLRGAVATLTATHDDSALSVDPGVLLRAVAELVGEIPTTKHPLGFMHFELTSIVGRAPSERVRLHLWSQETREWQDRLGTIHSHTWELNSLVLLGGLKDTVYEAVENGAGKYRAVEVTYGPSGPESKPTGDLFELRGASVREVTASHAYRLPAGTLHGSEPLAVPTVTLLHARESGKRSVLVLRDADLDSQPAAPRAEVHRADATRSLNEALAARS